MRVMAVQRRAAEETQVLRRRPAATPRHDILAGRYQITSLIGRGGMAEVHAAYDRHLERVVAIKRPRADVPHDAMASDRFKREAVALAAIDSPHVVAVHDVGFTPNGMYLVMQRLCGHTLEEEVACNGSVTPARACRIAKDILCGLSAIHASGLVHRDLKPSNVLIDRADRAILLDLGAALHPRKKSLTAPGTVLGTVGCMAPEQLELGPIDSRVDLYQLGLILVFLVTGTMADRPIDLNTLAVPVAMREVIAHALAPVGRRYTTAALMQKALHRALAACALVPMDGDKPTQRWPAMAAND